MHHDMTGYSFDQDVSNLEQKAFQSTVQSCHMSFLYPCAFLHEACVSYVPRRLV